MSTLVIFARTPIFGQVKTRLAASIGEAAALALYEAFLDDTCTLTQGLGARRVLAVEGPLDHPQLERLAQSQRLELIAQGEGDLGAKMGRLMASYLPSGPVILIGSDLPQLPRSSLHEALDALMDHDAVLGPADDGGYYLIGARVEIPGLFQGIAWSRPTVLAATRERLAGRSHWLLPAAHDVDTAADLERLRRELATLPGTVAPATRRLLASLGSC